MNWHVGTKNARAAGVRNTILPFARNALASMDFTPVTFSNHNNAHITTYAHELALSVVFESGLQHFADRVSSYTSLAAGPTAFLEGVPTTWDDTRFVEGLPGEWLVLARRKGSIWYVAGIDGAGQARDLTLGTGFLDAGSYAATVITDGGSDTTFDESSQFLTAADSLNVSLRARGGFVARLVPEWVGKGARKAWSPDTLRSGEGAADVIAMRRQQCE